MYNDTITLNLTLQSGQGNTCTESVKNDGILKWVRLTFPNSRGTVQARVHVNGHTIIPSSGQYIIDNGTVEFPIDLPITEGSLIVLEALNTDRTSPHTISLTGFVNYNQTSYNQQAYGLSQAIIEPLHPDDGAGISDSNQETNGSLPLPSPPSNGNGKAPLSFVSRPTPISQLPPPPSSTIQPPKTPYPTFTPRGPMRPPIQDGYSELYRGVYTHPSDVSPTNDMFTNGMDNKLFVLLLVVILVIAFIAIIYLFNNHPKSAK